MFAALVAACFGLAATKTANRTATKQGMMTMLTDAKIKEAIRKAPTSGKPRATLTDAGARGGGRLSLVIRTLATRVSAEWYAVYYRGSQRRLSKLGDYPDMSLAEARRLFAADYTPSIQSGADPSSGYARNANRKGAGDRTVGELFRAYIQHLKDTNKDHYGPERILLLRHNSAASLIGEDRPAKSIKPSDCVAYLAAIYGEGTQSMAYSCRSWLHAAFQFGLTTANDYRLQASASGGWGLTSNPVAAIPADTEARRAGKRHLSPEELRDFWRWCDKNRPRTAIFSALMIQAATGQRVQEILRLTAESYDAEAGMLYWPKTKNGTQHAIPLPKQAINVLASLKPNKFGLYFPQRNKPHLHCIQTTPNKLVAEYLELTGARHFTPRDLRRTWKTLAGLAGLTKEVRDRLQNHAMHDVSSKHYDRYDYLPEKRAAMAAWSEWLDGVLNEPEALNKEAA